MRTSERGDKIQNLLKLIRVFREIFNFVYHATNVFIFSYKKKERERGRCESFGLILSTSKSSRISVSFHFLILSRLSVANAIFFNQQSYRRY